MLSDSFGLPKNVKNREAAINFLKMVGSKEGQDAFNPPKGSIPARTDADMSKYTEYHKWAMEEWKKDKIVPSIVHGAAAPAGLHDRLHERHQRLRHEEGCRSDRCRDRSRLPRMPDSRSSPATTISRGRRCRPRFSTAPANDPGYVATRRSPLLVLIPSMVAVAIFIYFFIAYTFFVSVVKWPTLLPDYTFVGLDNWIRMFNDDRFRIDMRNLVLYRGRLHDAVHRHRLRARLAPRPEDQERSGLSHDLHLPVRRLRHRHRRGLALADVPVGGPEPALRIVGLGFLKSKWYTDPTWGILAVSIAASWQFSGYVMALYLAGLRGISHELKEAAAIDGASTWQLYRRIIIPLLAPVTFTAIVLTGMGSIRVFDIPPVLGTGAAFSTDFLSFYMFQLTFQSNRIALGAVIAGVMIILAAFLVGPYLASMQLEE